MWAPKPGNIPQNRAHTAGRGPGQAALGTDAPGGLDRRRREGRPRRAPSGRQAALDRQAELLADVCDSWLLDRPYNRRDQLRRARRLLSWDDAVGRLCQLELFA